MKTKTLLVTFAYIVMFNMISCNCTQKTTKDFKYDMTYFYNGEYTTMLSLYKIQHDTILDSLNSGCCFLDGRVLVRNGMDKYSGELFDKFMYIQGWPRIIIPELGIDKQIKDGFIHESLPCGTYDVILIANLYYPIHFRHTFENNHNYSVDFFLGCSSIH